MVSKRIVEKFNLAGKEVIFRYPKLENVDDHLQLINSLIEEKAMLGSQERKTKAEESTWLSNILINIKGKETVHLVVEVEGKVMGSAHVKKQSQPFQDHVGELGIGLRKEIRGKGISKRLLRSVVKEAKKVLGIKIVKLRVMGPNKVAQNLYKKCGFQVVGRIKKGSKYYGKYVDEVIMVKYL